ncbi:radical SAM protein [Clostridium perfringens]|uniref:Radical SAM protein n=1 Tax=Clostridium perfringens TaxID=1502 RepID=A0AAP6WNN5_CLOPF|nr:radical SAM protein [Clostridium perfringens]NGU31173.1 radical SAM protein [Clostridium perfringens]
MNGLKCNCCDGIYNSFDVHFTSLCDNKCSHCIDKCFDGMNIAKPNVNEIVNTIVKNKDELDDVLFLGGEPCLFLDELIDCVKQLKEKTKLKLFVTTSVPKVCHDRRDKFIELIALLDGINLSVQHYKEEVADEIRKTKSQYDRQAFYNSLPHKDKIRINLNIVKPYLYTKEDIEECLKHYDKMGFNSIKLSEIQHGKDVFVSFEKTFGIKLGSPFSDGCQTYLKMNEIIPNFKTPVLLKRSCFMCEDTLKATFKDGIKVLYKMFNKPNNKYGVVYENGSLEKGWI